MDPLLPLGPNPPTEASGPARADAKLARSARAFEAVFLGYLLKAMRSTGGSGGLFPRREESAFYRELFDQAVAQRMAAAGGIGLADLVVRDQERRQGWHGGTAAPTRRSAGWSSGPDGKLTGGE
jgi:Rod binding domain-containing protein